MDLSGIWPAQVIDNKDPGQKARLRIRTVHFGPDTSPDRIPDEHLPWARPCLPGVGTGSGLALVPPIGSGVWVMFLGQNPLTPIWLGGWLGTGDTISDLDYSEGGRPTSFVFKTPQANKLVLNDAAAGGVVVQDKIGQYLKLLPGTLATEFLSQTHNHNVTVERTITVEGANNKVVGANDSLDVTGNREEVITGTMTHTSALLTMISLAAITITAGAALLLTAGAAITVTAAAAINIFATSVILGQAASAKKLCNLDFMTLYNSHTHSYQIPTSSSSTGPTGVPTQQASEDTHTTTEVLAS